MKSELHNAGTGRPPHRGLIARWRRSDDGAAAIEFAILAIPFFLLLFAIIEACVAYAAEQVLDNAVDTMGRQLRTGQITFVDEDASTYMTEGQFREAFCDEIAVLLSCDDDRLYIDVESFDTFGAIPVGVPLQNGDLNEGAFGFDPGGPGTINMVRAYYRWHIITDLIRPYITNLHPSDGSSQYLIVGTAAFQNEDFSTALASSGS